MSATSPLAPNPDELASAPDPGEGAALGPWALWRLGGRQLLALLAVAALIKLVVVAAALQSNPHLRRPTSDSLYYLDRAMGLAGLGADPLANEAHHLPPLYPAVLAALPGVTEGDFGALLAFQSLAGLALLAAVFAFARRRTGQLGALVATGLVMAYGPITFFETKLLGDSLATVLLIGALVMADGWSLRPTIPRAVCLALVLGAACLLRPQALLLVPLAAVWLGKRQIASAAALLVTVLLCLLPSAWHNFDASGDLILVSDNGGVNLWLAATGPESGTFRTDDQAFGDIANQAAEARRRAEAAAGEPLSAGEVSSHFSALALARWWEDPGGQLRRVGLRALALIENFETGVVTVPQVEAGVVPPLAILALPFVALFAAAGAGAVFVIGRARAPGTAPVAPALALTAMVTVTALLFFHYSRFRLPLVPLLAVVVGTALQSVLRSRPQPGRIAIALLVAGGLAWLSMLPASHHRNALANGWTSLADARRGIAQQNDRAALESARADVGRALDVDPGFVRAWLSAAELDLALGAFDGADHWLDRLELVLPDETQVLASRAILSLLAHPSNRHVDVARGRAARDRLAARAADDPNLAPLIDSLDSMLARMTLDDSGG